MAALTPNQILSLTGLGVPWPESLPIPADEPTDAGDLFQTAGMYRGAADTLSSLATWKYQLPYPKFYMAKLGKGVRLAWNLRLPEND